MEDLEDMFPEDFNPFKKDGEETASVMGPDDVEPDDEEVLAGEVYNDVEEVGLSKVCVGCQQLMERIEGTAAQIFEDPTRDDVDVRTWAKCPKCGGIIAIA